MNEVEVLGRIKELEAIVHKLQIDSEVRNMSPGNSLYIKELAKKIHEGNGDALKEHNKKHSEIHGIKRKPRRKKNV